MLCERVAFEGVCTVSTKYFCRRMHSQTPHKLLPFLFVGFASYLYLFRSQIDSLLSYARTFDSEIATEVVKTRVRHADAHTHQEILSPPESKKIKNIFFVDNSVPFPLIVDFWRCVYVSSVCMGFSYITFAVASKNIVCVCPCGRL